MLSLRGSTVYKDPGPQCLLVDFGAGMSSSGASFSSWWSCLLGQGLSGLTCSWSGEPVVSSSLCYGQKVGVGWTAGCNSTAGNHGLRTGSCQQKTLTLFTFCRCQEHFVPVFIIRVTGARDCPATLETYNLGNVYSFSSRKFFSLLLVQGSYFCAYQ